MISKVKVELLCVMLITLISIHLALRQKNGRSKPKGRLV